MLKIQDFILRRDKSIEILNKELKEFIKISQISEKLLFYLIGFHLKLKYQKLL